MLMLLNYVWFIQFIQNKTTELISSKSDGFIILVISIVVILMSMSKKKIPGYKSIDQWQFHAMCVFPVMFLVIMISFAK